jgi:hypothetical protein
MSLKLRVAAGLLFIAVPAIADDIGWPVVIDAGEGWEVTLYQPQVDDFSDNDLQCRAAVSVTGPDVPEPVFGAVWITARLDIDRQNRTVQIAAVEVPDVRFPEASEEGKQRLADLLESEIPTWDLDISLDRFLADLEELEGALSVDGLKHDPPIILFSTEPAMLVTIDGEPRLRDIPGQVGQSHEVQYVVNSAFPVMYDPRSLLYYICGGGELWYSSRTLEGSWYNTRAIPSSVKFVAPKEEQSEDEPTVRGGPAPKIVVATEPTELIVSAGEPEWARIEGLDLSYMSNSDSAVLLDTANEQYYVVLSGRWYRSSSFGGPWEFVPPDRLPGSLRQIPADSPVGTVLAHVAGTQDSREAVLDAQIPQTAAVKRDATIRVFYDGIPQFEGIEGTDLQYAVNTPFQVIKAGGTYYCCDQGAWYVADGPKGPWKVCTDVPEEIYDIPPSNPNHNVTYVHVYDETPEVVHVAYTPGYLGSYYFGGCTVYGTGWYYPGWYGSSYYPGQSTWGFHSVYNPWTGGWGFGVGWTNGPITISIGVSGWGGHYGGGWGWFGVGGYYPYPRAYPYPGYTRPGSGVYEGVPHGGGGNGIYGRSVNANRVAPGYDTSALQQPRYASGSTNNIYTDRTGNVYRRNQDGSWDQRVGGGWNPSVSHPQALQGDHAARQRGAERTQRYQSRR